jgi:hypothetical protein
MEFRVILLGASPSLNDSAEQKVPRGPSLFYTRRHHVYTGLLLFIVVVGLPVVSVPYLRNRLSARILMLKAGMAGEIKPVVAQVGANQEPFPAEYERQEPAVPQAFKLPPSEKIIATRPGGYIPLPAVSSHAAPKALKPESPPPSVESEESSAQAEAGPSASEESELKYQQGENEQKAYDLLLKSNPTIAEMIHGSNPSLRFESWDAAYRGDDNYWVRLKFQSDNNPDMEYIWQVKLGSKEVTPLSYHARSIS